MSCIFCKIIKGDIPSFKLYEDEFTFVFMDINPLSFGHLLIIPKYHAVLFHELPVEYATAIGTTLHRVASAMKLEQYNILNNNGSVAGQVVKHVHVHIIPRTTEDGLKVRWSPLEGESKPSMDQIKEYANELITKLQ